MDKNKCEIHDQELVQIRTNFENFKIDISRQLKELKEDIKEFSRPQFTSAQLTAILLTALGYMAGIMIYVEGIKSDSRVNTVKIENTIEQYKMINIKLDKIIDDK